MLAWALPRDVREEFRKTVGFDEATWARARCWVVQQTAMDSPYYSATLPEAVIQARRRLEEAIEDQI
jgi:hypothetical protein